MNEFKQFTSNSIAGSGNQFFFCMDKHEVRTGRVFYKITHGGTFCYSLLFSNVTDTTYSDGLISKKNQPCEPWTIHRARVGRCKENIFAQDACRHREQDVFAWNDLLFDGQIQKEVSPAEVFWSDPLKLTFDSGEYLCLEITFSGTKIPYHEESILPVFIKDGDNWVYNKQMPFAGMIGCDRKVGCRIGFWGDSITQGIGTPINSYAHWNALVAKKLGDAFAYWNLGIGFARANDAASLGAWWDKAKQNDVIVLCMGANDILQNFSEEQIKHDLSIVLDAIQKQGIRVVLQTVPPFEYTDEQAEVWQNVNDFIRNELSQKAELLFDVVPLLRADATSHLPKFGGHPNEEGCRIWADALYEQLTKYVFPTA